MKTLLEQLEPGAQNSLNGLDMCVRGSVAISLKRIADNSDRMVAAIEGELAHPEWGIVPTIREVMRGR